MRTFLALDIDEQIRSRLCDAVGRIDTQGAKIKWVAPANLHVTLKFLGELPETKLPEVCRLVEAAARQVEAFEFHVSSVLCVPPAGRVRMFWAGATDPTGRMAELYEKLSASLDGMGFAEDNRAFRPHITLGRVKAAAKGEALRRQVEQFVDVDFGTMYTDAVAVYASQLRPGGPVYTVIDEAPLGSAEPAGRRCDE